MSEASPQFPDRHVVPAEQAADIGSAYRQMADAVKEMARSDEGIEAGGLAVGAVAGTGIAIFAEGMKIHPAEQTDQNHYTAQPHKGTPPMVEANTAQFATIGGLTVLGLAAATAYARFRNRPER